MAEVGDRTRHVDWQAITDGSVCFTADIMHEGELVASVLRSPHAHAKILAIDVTRARGLPGVWAVLTAADVTQNLYLDYRPLDRDRRILANDVVRYIGEPVALVAAESEEVATKAIDLIDVRYERLSIADTVERALSSAAPAIQDHCPKKNIAAEVKRSLGLASTELPKPAHSVRASYHSGRQAHATMEPHTVKAHWRSEENCLHVWAPSQNPRLLQRDLAQLFELATESVRMHGIAIGGDFGGRTQISSTEALVCALSIATHRAVSLSQSRAEEFAFTKWRLCWDMDLELSCDAAGKVIALDATFDVDNGAYNQAGPGEMIYGSVALGSSYRWLAYRADGKCVYTNKSPASSFRGAGGYAVNWALECAIDELADKVGMDPIDFRLLNAVAEEGETSVTGWKVKSSGLHNCLEAVRREIDWDEKRRVRKKGRGVGVACTVHVTALARDYMLRSHCGIEIDRQGRLLIRSGCGDSGMGQKTLICQAVSAALGVALDRISIMTTDTATTPYDAGAGASRGSFVAVNAALALTEKVKRELTAIAAEHLGRDLNEFDWKDGMVRRGNHVMGLSELVALANRPDDVYRAEAEYVGDFHDPDPTGYEDIAPTYSFAAHAVEVEVDQETGLTKIVKVVAAHDSGTILNPISARGQVEGGVVMGLGAILGESLVFEEGRVVNPSYTDYVMPRATDAPVIDTIFVDVTDPVGPFGSKGIGEIPLITIGPAVTNAIAHATGVRLRSAPHTPDKIVMACRMNAGKPLSAGSIYYRPSRWWTAMVRAAYPKGLQKGLQRLAEYVPPPDQTRRIENVVAASTLEQALQYLRDDPTAAPIAGGTDILALETQGLPVPRAVVDIASLDALRKIELQGDGSLRIGAAVTLSELIDSKFCDGVLRNTIDEIATEQIRQVATVAGNLCQAKRCWFYRNGFDCYKRGGATRPCYAVQGDHRFYHAIQDAHRCQATTPSDLATTLLALDATAQVQSAGNRRSVSIDKLYQGPGEVSLARDEVMTAIEIPTNARKRRSVYRKLSLWRGAFAIANICVSVQSRADERVSGLRVVLGGTAPVPLRIRSLEDRLEGKQPDSAAIEDSVERWLADTHPLKNNHWKAFATTDLLWDALSKLLMKQRARS